MDMTIDSNINKYLRKNCSGLGVRSGMESLEKQY